MGSVEYAAKFFSAGADAHADASQEMPECNDAILLACKRGHVDVLRLVARIAGLDRDQLLLAACYAGVTEIAAHAIHDLGASLTVDDQFLVAGDLFMFPVYAAGRSGNLGLLKMLCGEAQAGDIALELAFVLGEVVSGEIHFASLSPSDAVVELIALGAMENHHFDSDHPEPLHSAIEAGLTLKALRAMLDSGASVTAVNDRGLTALHVACEEPPREGHDSAGVVSLLIRHGSDPAAGMCP